MTPRTMFDKIWDAHVVREEPDKPSLLYVDLHLVHEVTSPQAFEGLRLAGRTVRRPDLTVATVDHNVPTTDRRLPIRDEISRKQIEALKRNCEEFGVQLYGIESDRPEVVHVLATQCLLQNKPKTMEVRAEGPLPRGVTAKDIVLGIIGRIGVDGATGHVIEYTGEAVRALSMEGRMTVCNMSIEGGASAGMIAP